MTTTALIIYVAVALLATAIGIILARRRPRTAEQWIARRRCPSCKSRKLVLTPTSPKSFVASCTGCGDQFYNVEVGRGREAATYVAPVGNLDRNAYTPEIGLTWGPVTCNPIFQTRHGVAEYDLTNVPIRPSEDVTTPRKMLALFARLQLEPVRLALTADLRPADLAQGDELRFFYQTAAIELPDHEDA